MLQKPTRLQDLFEEGFKIPIFIADALKKKHSIITYFGERTGS